MELKTVILEDEPMALRLLEEDLRKIPFVKFEAAFGDALEALTWLQNHPVDLLITDINMPGLNGLQLIKSLSRKPFLIISSAHKDYAVEGYDLDVVDYLLKPYSFERLLKGVMKVYKLKQDQTANHEKTVDSGLNGSILLRSNYKDLSVQLDNILYIKALKDYVMVYTRSHSKAIITQQTMKEMEEKLPEHWFARVHRSYIVSLEALSSLSRSEVSVGEEVIPVGELYRKTLMDRYEQLKNR